MKKKLLFVAVIMALALGHANAETTAVGAAPNKYKEKRQELLAKLPKEKADLLNNRVTEQKAKDEEIQKKASALRKEKKSILIAEKFDKEAYLAKSAELTKLHASKYENHAKAIAELAPQFTPEERKVLYGAFHRPWSGKKSGAKEKKEE